MAVPMASLFNIYCSIFAKRSYIIIGTLKGEGMRFRPCIDIHNGAVKQIVGASLKDEGDQAAANFISTKNAEYYARMYQRDGLTGGHVILLNAVSSDYYEATRRQAFAALSAYPQGMQAGGGITADNAAQFLEAGASHVIVTSYVFRDGKISWENLEKLVHAVGKEHIVLDLSCRQKDDGYYIVTDRWQRFTEVKLCGRALDSLAGYCDEFLVHGVDVEGKISGVEEGIVRLLAAWDGAEAVTYAGGIGSMDDVQRFREISRGRLDFTVGSALDIFGGKIPYSALCYE